ncbi:unnamed protein product [Fusarium graminearum]|nr:unnamed protein product [Fusarium graminearum]
MRYSTAAAAFLATGAMAHYDEVSKVYETKHVTITSCGPEVTNCPARSTVVSTTSYPVPPKVTSAQQGADTTEAYEVPEVPATTEIPEAPTTEAPMTTSTIYSTNIKTITSCGPEVPNCPATGGTPVVVTETIAVSTTICPVEPTGGSEKPGKPETPGQPEKPDTPGTPEQPEQPEKPEQPETPETPGKPEQPPAPPAQTQPEQPPAPPAQTKPVVPEQPGHPGNGTVPQPPPVYPNPPATESGAKPIVPPTPVPGQPEQCVPSQSVTAITKEYTTVLTSVEYSTVQVPCATGTNPTTPETPETPEKPQNPGEPEVPAPTGPAAGVPPPATTPIGGGNQTMPTPPAVTAGASTFAGSAFFAAVAGIAAFIMI